jgi:hypothetical protein
MWKFLRGSRICFASEQRVHDLNVEICIHFLLALMHGEHTFPLTLIQLIQIFWSKEETVLSLTVGINLVFTHERRKTKRENGQPVVPSVFPGGGGDWKVLIELMREAVVFSPLPPASGGRTAAAATQTPLHPNTL